MNESPNVREFRTIADLHEVPVEKLQAFVTDLALWLQLHRLGDERGFTVTTPRDVFGWIDDGRHDVTMRVEVKRDESVATHPATERQPTWCRCAKCQHVWVVVYVPIAADVFARICKRATCPMCGEQKRLFLYESGKTPMEMRT